MIILLVALMMSLSACHNHSSNQPEPGAGYSEVTKELIDIVDADPSLKKLLEKAIAKGAQINPDKKTNPAQTLEQYYDFVDWAASSIPWTVLSQPEGTDIFTRIDQSLNYFFFINDIPLEELEGMSLYNNSLQYYEPYRSWLKSFAMAWGAFLDTEESWTQEYYDLVAKEELFGISKGWYEDPSNWETFNDFFSRRLKSPDMRPIASPENNLVVVSPADAATQGVWQIDEEGYIVQKEEHGVQIKSRKFSSVAELVGPESIYRDAFKGGTLTHSFLNVFDYHRYHYPVAGSVKEISVIDGDYAVGGSIKWNPQTQRYDLHCEVPGWQSIETRGCVIVETKEYGLVALLPIGMMPVTSICWNLDIKEGDEVVKGDELGFFQFGGSDFVILFQDGVEFTLTPPVFTHQLMGEELGRIEISN